MNLKRLEIIGFKSFAQKTVFDIPMGAVGIVGPNGSGKSNITDAIRWVLGERDSKNLRGDKIEDLIFAGTEKRARVSMASVSLVFDNSDGTIPVDFKEVIITRKISRDAVSEYLINNARVRLKDIVDIFSKMKIGSKGFSIIGQGSGDLFVSSNPQHRMMMVREMLGLREYEIKKHESELKLKNTRLHMDKLNAIMQEILPRLRMLKRQTTKWDKRSGLEENLLNLENDYFVLKLIAINNEIDKIKLPLPKIEKSISLLMEKLNDENAKLNKVKESSNSSQQLQDLINKKNKLFSDRLILERSLFENKVDVRDSNTEHANNTYDQIYINNNFEKILGQLKKLLNIDSLNIVREQIEKIIDNISNNIIKKQKDNVNVKNKKINREKLELNKKTKDKINKINANIYDIEKEEVVLSNNIKQFQSFFTASFESVQSVKDKISSLNEKKREIEFKKERLEYQISELRRKANSSGVSWSDISNNINKKTNLGDISDEKFFDMEHKINILKAELSNIGEVDQKVVLEEKEVDSHYNIIKKEYEDLQLASKDLLKLIKDISNILHKKFEIEFTRVNSAFNLYFKTMFGGGNAKMVVLKNEGGDKTDNIEPIADDVDNSKNGEGNKILDNSVGIDIKVQIPQKKASGLNTLSGGERSLVSLAALFALISVSAPPFIVMDETDAALDEKNSARFASLIETFSKHTQFIVVTHNRVTMKAAGALYGVTMGDDGVSKILSLKLER